MKGRRKEKRKGERISTTLPVSLGKRQAITRDVSASGMLLETDAAYSLGSPVDLALDLDTPWGKVMLRCKGKIVRVERRDDTVGVAVKFEDSDGGGLDSGLRRNDEML